MDVAAMAQALPDWVPADRLAHVWGVHDTALVLADRFGIDRERAAVAALLHDIAKAWSGADLLRAATEFDILVDIVEQLQPGLLHGPVGAELARREFGVTDEGVLQAVRLHTTGDWAMTDLDLVVFLADLIEPGRSFAGVDEVRDLARTDLYRASLEALRLNLAYVMRRGWLIHARSVAAYNWLIAGRN